jgi:predicted ester cyclase
MPDDVAGYTQRLTMCARESADDLIRRYYDSFNARDLDEAARLFAPAARVEHLPGSTALRGGDAYLQFARTWLTAFPDANFSIERIRAGTDRLHEVDLIGRGTHTGTLEFGSWVFHSTARETVLRFRELIEVEDAHFVFASLSVDLQDLIRQLTTIDVDRLRQHLGRLERLNHELGGAREGRQHELLDAIGRELDAARRTIRPYFR